MIKKAARRISRYVQRQHNQHVNRLCLKKSSEKLKTFHKLHEGKRCFIVGNGPSLRVEDLQKLEHEICFGSHRIYKIFGETQWRPDYYCAQDSKLVNESIDEINQMDLAEKFIAVVPDRHYEPLKHVNYVHLIEEEFYPQLPKFSSDISKGVYEGYTVSYMCLQLAVYMGFQEIYLLGIDHNYSVTLLPNGELLENKNIQDHFSSEDVTASTPQLFKSTLSYQAARKYADANGIKILNATRGGKLDAFERVDFDTLF